MLARGRNQRIIILSVTAVALTFVWRFWPETDSLELEARVMAPLYEKPNSVSYPKENPYSPVKQELGKALFFDPRLSSSKMMACASCHNPGLSWGNGLPRAVGHGHKVLSRKSPTLIGVSAGDTFFWDGRAASLEEQALGPIQSPDEMNFSLLELESLVKNLPEYDSLYREAFPGEPVHAKNIARAIATYERTIEPTDSPFDAWVSGNRRAISDSAKRGFVLFNSKARCVTCHVGFYFTNGTFADVGLPSDDLGRGKIEGKSDLNHAFKTPTLRDISRRGPYMHDGSLKTLAEVVEHYNQGGTVRRETTKLFFSPLELSNSEKEDLISFLQTLTGKQDAVTLPVLPRSESGGIQWVKFISQ